MPTDGRPPLPLRERVAHFATTARNLFPDVAGTLGDTVATARAVAFWSAIALPVLNLALLFEGLSTPAETTTFLTLLVANLVALLVGHPYQSD